MLKLTEGLSNFEKDLTFPIPTAPYFLNMFSKYYSAMGFTSSVKEPIKVGKNLLAPNVAARRPQPIPFFKDTLLNSVNISGDININKDTFSNSIKLFDNFQNYINTYNIVFVVGCGGTGGYLIRDLGRYISTLPYQDKTLVVLIDGDKVEIKNLTRQNFISKDLNANKAEVLAKRYSSHYNIQMVSYPSHLTKENITDLMGIKALGDLIDTYFKPIAKVYDTDRSIVNLSIISCVDNNGTRKLLHNFLIDSNRWSITEPDLYTTLTSTFSNPIMGSISWIDSGNETTSGQVVAYYDTHFANGIFGLLSDNHNSEYTNRHYKPGTEEHSVTLVSTYSNSNKLNYTKLINGFNGTKYKDVIEKIYDPSNFQETDLYPYIKIDNNRKLYSPSDLYEQINITTLTKQRSRVLEYFMSPITKLNLLNNLDYIPVPNYFGQGLHYDGITGYQNRYKAILALDHNIIPNNDAEATSHFKDIMNIMPCLNGITTFPVTSIYPNILKGTDDRTNLQLSCAEHAIKDSQTLSVNVAAASAILVYFSQIFAATPAGSFLTSYGCSFNRGSSKEFPITFGQVEKILRQYEPTVESKPEIISSGIKEKVEQLKEEIEAR